MGTSFFEYVRGSLIPNMLPFDGNNPRSIAVLDNCSIHHVQSVVELFRVAGIGYLHIAQTSILRKMLSVRLKEHDEILQVVIDPIPIIEAAFDSITPEDCIGWSRHYGY